MMFYRKLKALRKKREMTLTELSILSDTSLGYLYKLENDPFSNPSLNKLYKLAKALDVEVSELIHKTKRRK